MKINKLMGLVLACAMLVSNVQIAKAEMTPGDSLEHAIGIQQNDKKTSVFTPESKTKFFNLYIKEQGTLKISYQSEKMKKAVTLTLDYNEAGNMSDSKTIKYNKKKKIASGTMTATYILAPGYYTVTLNAPAPVEKNTKFTLKTTFTAKKYDDKEPNNAEESAQIVKLSNKQTGYKMFLSGKHYDMDLIDYFKCSVKDNEKIKISASTNSAAKIRVLLKCKENGQTKVLNGASDQYFEKNGASYTFKYTSDKLPKGEYEIMFWLEGGEDEQVEYTVKLSKA